MHGLAIFIGAAVVLVILVRKRVLMRQCSLCSSLGPSAREDRNYPCCGLVLPDRFETVRQSGGGPAPLAAKGPRHGDGALAVVPRTF